MANSIFTLNELKENYEAIKRLLSDVQSDHVHMQKSLDLLEDFLCRLFPEILQDRQRLMQLWR